MLDKVKAIIFDLDGTLIDSMWLWKQIDIDYLAKFNIELPDSLQDEIEGKSFTETAQFFKERFQLDDDVEMIKRDWNDMASIYYMEKVMLKAHVIPFLKHLKDKGVKMGIATSNSKVLVTKIVERFNLSVYFESIRTSCEVDKGKPAPDVYLKVAEDLVVEPKDCLVFEDVINGVLAGQSAGMKVCAVYDEFSRHAKISLEEMADYYIESFAVVLALA
ncbi:MAG: HAD family phosphatase [Vallitaleaceae bacterium]|nr:HAD family phosphatase [Vallitaleaceae bacterium]